MALSGKIFINYRRGDDPGATGRLYDRLQAAFAPEQLFMDVEGGIAAGADFVDVLREQVAACDVLLAVIGPRWLTIADETERPRLENPDDFVRIEIEAALQQGKIVVPVLVGGAAIPSAEQLPPNMKPLARRNAVRLTHERFQADCAGLIKSLETELAKAVATRVARDEAAARAAEAEERARAEAAQRQRQEEAERQRQQARAQLGANLTPDQIARAEELANWEFIKGGTDVQEFRDHLARFPAGVTLRMARAKLASAAWIALGSKPSKGDLEGYLQEFLDSPHRNAAQQALGWLDTAARAEQAKAEQAREAQARAAREAAAWEVVKNTTDIKTLDAFLADWPNGTHAAEAKRLRRAMGSGGDTPWILLSIAYAVLAVPVTFLFLLLLRALGIVLKSPSSRESLIALLSVSFAFVPIALRGWTITATELATYWFGALWLLSLVAFSWRDMSRLDDINKAMPELAAGIALITIAPFVLSAIVDPGPSRWPWVIHWLGAAALMTFYLSLAPYLRYLQPIQAVSTLTGLPIDQGQVVFVALLLTILALIFAAGHLWFARRAQTSTFRHPGEGRDPRQASADSNLS